MAIRQFNHEQCKEYNIKGKTTRSCFETTIQIICVMAPKNYFSLLLKVFCRVRIAICQHILKCTSLRYYSYTSYFIIYYLLHFVGLCVANDSSSASSEADHDLEASPHAEIESNNEHPIDAENGPDQAAQHSVARSAGEETVAKPQTSNDLEIVGSLADTGASAASGKPSEAANVVTSVEPETGYSNKIAHAPGLSSAHIASVSQRSNDEQSVSHFQHNFPKQQTSHPQPQAQIHHFKAVSGSRHQSSLSESGRQLGEHAHSNQADFQHIQPVIHQGQAPAARIINAVPKRSSAEGLQQNNFQRNIFHRYLKPQSHNQGPAVSHGQMPHSYSMSHNQYLSKNSYSAENMPHGQRPSLKSYSGPHSSHNHVGGMRSHSGSHRLNGPATTLYGHQNRAVRTSSQSIHRGRSPLKQQTRGFPTLSVSGTSSKKPIPFGKSSCTLFTFITFVKIVKILFHWLEML